MSIKSSLSGIALGTLVGLTSPAFGQEKTMLASADVDQNASSIARKVDGVIVGGPIEPQEIYTSNEFRFKERFDLNRDGEISVSEINKFFDMDLNDFNRLYRGDIYVFDTDSLIMSLKSNISDLEEKRSLSSNESENDSIKKSIDSLVDRIKSRRKELYLSYFSLLEKKINHALNDDNDKILFLSYLPNIPELADFKIFVQANIAQAKNDGKQHQEVSYVPKENTKGLKQLDEAPDLSAFSQKEQDRLLSSFINPNEVHNARLLSKSLTQDNVFEFLCDVNSDGKLTQDDKGEIYGLQCLSVLKDIESQFIAQGREQDFYNNLSYVFSLGGVQVPFDSREGLLSMLKTNPENKFYLFHALKSIILNKGDLAYVLTYGKDGFREYNELKEELANEAIIGKIISKLEEGFSLAKRELAQMKLKGVITNKEYVDKLAIIERYKLDPSYKDKILESALSILSQVSSVYLSENGQLSGLKIAYSNKAFRPQFQEQLNDAINSLSLDLGVVNLASGNMLMIGISHSKEYDLGPDSKLVTTLGTRVGLGNSNNVLPFFSLGFVEKLNSYEIKASGYKEFDISEESFSLSISAGLLNTTGLNYGLFLGWSKDRLEALQIKTSQYTQIVDKFFAYDGVSNLEEYIDLLKKRLTKPEFKELDYLGNTLENIRISLDAFGFNQANDLYRAKYIENLRAKTVNDFLTFYAKIEDSKGREFSRLGVGIGAISKASILPSLGWDEINNNYIINQGKATFSGISGELKSGKEIDMGSKQTQFLSQLNKFLNIQGLKVTFESGLIKITTESGENVFDFLNKAGMSVFLEPTEEILSQVGFENNTIVIGDVGNIGIYVITSNTSRTVSLILGNGGSYEKVQLTRKMTEILGDNYPSSMGNIQVNGRNIVIGNDQRIEQSTFGF
ncbi:MAG: hypothetical protein PHI37_02830 [Candidatus Gracilibacteria bacterium]|nr:hypothetical protein [Candidatus Gracilibacteria bacterium]